MKNFMKRFSVLVLSLLTVFIILLAMTVLAVADPGTATAAAPAATQPDPSIVAWFSLYKSYIFAAALTLGELMAVTPWFKGNGIIDTIIKALKMLCSKETAQ